MSEFGIGHRRVELDQDIAGFDAFGRREPESTRTTPVSNGWMVLVRPLGMSLPGATATISTVPRHAQASATPKTR